MKIYGQVSTGLGTGRYFMSIPEYKKRFVKKLEWEPYEGTLNLIVDDKDIESVENLKKKTGISISGFEHDGITFYGAKMFKAKIPKYKYECAAVIFPHVERNSRNVIQIIAPDYLRGKFKLEDGDELEIEVEE